MGVDEPAQGSATRHDGIAFGCGLLVFIASFLPWYQVTLAGGPAESGVTGTYNAWHGLAGLGLILLLFSLVVAAAEPFAGDVFPPLPIRLLTAALACVGAALVILRSLNLPSVDIPGAQVGLRWGGWVLIVLVVLQAMISILRVVHAGDVSRDEPIVPNLPSA
ncbi:MAG: hypothetical protein ACTHK4_15380 [Mycobacteriales bacterium]